MSRHLDVSPVVRYYWFSLSPLHSPSHSTMPRRTAHVPIRFIPFDILCRSDGVYCLRFSSQQSRFFDFTSYPMFKIAESYRFHMLSPQTHRLQRPSKIINKLSFRIFFILIFTKSDVTKLNPPSIYCGQLSIFKYSQVLILYKTFLFRFCSKQKCFFM